MPPLRFDPIAEAGRQWATRWGPETAPPMLAVTSIMRVQQIVLARLTELLEPHGLTYARYEALMLLHHTRTGSLPLNKVGGRLQLHPTSITNLVDGLERAGLATRTPHPTDRRTTLAAITDRGREVARAATEALNAANFGIDPLDGEQAGQLVALLREVRVHAGDFDAAAGPDAPAGAPADGAAADVPGDAPVG